MYCIADINMDIKCNYSPFEDYCTDFFAEKNCVQICLSLNHEDMNNEFCGTYVTSKLCLESAALLRKLAEALPQFDAVVLHSACFDVDGVGVAFAAHSGTGKTTHMNLWQRYLGDKMVVVNGDKPIVRFFEDEPEQPYAYGTPWNGKERLGCNMRTPLKHICFIERSETNYVEKVDKKAIIDRIFNQVYMPKDPQAMIKTMQLIDRLVSCCDLWIIHCNMEDDAAKVAYETIFQQQ